MVNEKTWKEFRETGLLLIINQILHIFGWAIVFEFDNSELSRVYPARVKSRGFDDESIERSYLKVSEYMSQNHEELLKEAKE